MKIRIHVDRLILEGLPVTSHQGPLVQAAMEAELTRLFTDSDFTAGLQSSVAVPNLQANAIQLSATNTPTQMGNQIAGSVYSRIGDKR